jgi:hypothetical protein
MSVGTQLRQFANTGLPAGVRFEALLQACEFSHLGYKGAWSLLESKLGISKSGTHGRTTFASGERP